MRWVILLLFGLFQAACSTLPHALECPPESNPVRDRRIMVVSHGWHTGLIVPAEDAERSLPFLRERFRDATAYEFGWGDKGFYMADEITTRITLKALFWAEGSVVHVVALHEDPETSFPHSQKEKVALSEKEMANLGRYLDSSFQRDASGRVLGLRGGLYGDSQFYEGVGRYHALNTCNKWTAKGLRSAGGGISPGLKLTASSVMSWTKSQPKR